MTQQPPGRQRSSDAAASAAVRDVQQQLALVGQRRESVRERLVDLRAAVAEDGREPLVEAISEEPTIEEACREIERETLEALHEELVDVVVEAPDRVPDDEGTDQLDDVAARLTEHHDELMAAVGTLDEFAGETEFDREQALSEIDTAIEQVDHIGWAVQRLTQLVARLAPTPEAAETPTEYAVSGTVRHGEDPVEGVVVRAVDVDVGTEQVLGETWTDEHGAYRISFDPDAFAADDLFGPDIEIRIVNAVGAVVGTSSDRQNVGPETTVDVTIPEDDHVEPTELALLRHELEQILGTTTLESLTDEQRKFVERELDLTDREAYPADERTLDYLSTAVELAGRTPFSEALLYGLARAEEGLTLERLREGDPEFFAESLGGTVSSGIVDIPTENLMERLAAGIDALNEVAKLEQRTETQATLTVSRPDGTALSRYTVHVVDPDDERKRQTLRTDENGAVTLTYLQPEGEDTARTFRVTVVNATGSTIHEGTVTVDGGTTEITVEHTSEGVSGTKTLETIVQQQDIEVPELDTLGDVTLADVRKAGGVGNLASDLGDDDAAKRINALASFDLMTDVGTGTKLFDQGFTNQFQIATTDRDEFMTQLQGTLGAGSAERIHASARAQMYVADNVLTDRRTALRNRGLGTGGDGDGE